MNKPIRPMLACSDTILTKDNYDQLTFPVIVSTKLDGWRCNVDAENNPLSRSGKHLPNVHTRKEIQSAGLAGFDGELIAGSPTNPNAMQAAQSTFSSIGGEPDFTYHIFDNWKRASYGFYSYWNEVIKYSSSRLPSWAVIVPQVKVVNANELADFVKACTDMGYEGAVVRDPLSPYKHGRSTWRQGWMLKAKEYVYEEGVIIRLNEKMHNMNMAERDELGFTRRSTAKRGKVPANTLGSFTVRNTKGVEFSIGTGSLNDQAKQNIWDLRHSDITWVGLIITYKHFAQSGVRNKPRHGQFVTLRDPADMGG